MSNSFKMPEDTFIFFLQCLRWEIDQAADFLINKRA